MTQAEQPPTTNPSDVYLTRRGERVVAEHLHLKLPESPEEYFRTLGLLRKEARDEIERLIDFLDRAAGDPDLEPSLGENPYIGNPATVDLEGDDTDKEPALGWTGIINQESRHRLGELHDSELDDCDREPLLASPENRTSQEAWAIGARRDMEEEHDGREYDDEDREPEEEGGDHAPDPEYFARLKARRPKPQHPGATFIGPNGETTFLARPF